MLGWRQRIQFWKEKLSETGPNMSEILANYMIFNARKYTFICVFLMQMFGYGIETKEEKIILEKTGIVFGLFLCPL